MNNGLIDLEEFFQVCCKRDYVQVSDTELSLLQVFECQRTSCLIVLLPLIRLMFIKHLDELGKKMEYG